MLPSTFLPRNSISYRSWTPYTVSSSSLTSKLFIVLTLFHSQLGGLYI